MSGGRRRRFGRIDPYCWLAVLPGLAVAALLIAMNAVLVGLGCAVCAGLLLVFDSWANRPEPPPERRGPAAARTSRHEGAVTRVQPRVRNSGSSPASRSPRARPRGPR
ncbi:hypothetical protein [Amycolatopsis circi]|uniref:hypothetical protein n=1 Tax=Amycolatopsis circi TaxID=871959 RepID=UPI0013BE9422|nr:hypothetical protein [Amycolatopsis circi]